MLFRFFYNTCIMELLYCVFTITSVFMFVIERRFRYKSLNDRIHRLETIVMYCGEMKKRPLGVPPLKD